MRKAVNSRVRTDIHRRRADVGQELLRASTEVCTSVRVSKSPNACTACIHTHNACVSTLRIIIETLNRKQRGKTAALLITILIVSTTVTMATACVCVHACLDLSGDGFEKKGIFDRFASTVKRSKNSRAFYFSENPYLLRTFVCVCKSGLILCEIIVLCLFSAFQSCRTTKVGYY